MKWILAAVLWFGVAASWAQQGEDGFLATPERLIPLDSEEGRAAFARSRSGPFFRLAQFYAVQPNLATCGVASCMMVLNGIGAERPVSANHGEFRLFTAENFFTREVENVVKREKVDRSGMTLAELGKVLEASGAVVETVPVAKVDENVFREEVKRCVAGKERMMLVNYLRKSLGQKTGGHISPIGAYDEAGDRVLVMDVSAYKYPWVWVKTGDLFAAMGDNEGVSRGYVVVKGRD